MTEKNDGSTGGGYRSVIENDLQAMVTGAIAGALMDSGFLDITVVTDDEGNYLPNVKVKGNVSGTELRVVVMTEEEWIEAISEQLADEAEAGYDVGDLRPRRRTAEPPNDSLVEEGRS